MDRGYRAVVVLMELLGVSYITTNRGPRGKLRAGNATACAYFNAQHSFLSLLFILAKEEEHCS